MIQFDMANLRHIWFILGTNNQQPSPELKKQYHALDHYRKEQLIQAREKGIMLAKKGVV